MFRPLPVTNCVVEQTAILVFTAVDACKNNDDCRDVTTVCWKPLRRCMPCTTLCEPGRPTQRSCATQPRCNTGMNVHLYFTMNEQSAISFLRKTSINMDLTAHVLSLLVRRLVFWFVGSFCRWFVALDVISQKCKSDFHESCHWFSEWQKDTVNIWKVKVKVQGQNHCNDNLQS